MKPVSSSHFPRGSAEISARGPRALTLTELLVVLAIGAILTTLSVVAISQARRAQSQTICAANLRGIHIAFQDYLMDNGGRYPQPSTSGQWEDLLRRYIHRTTFHCPGDQELFPSLGSSYDWRDTADADSSLAGQMYTIVLRPNVSLAFDSLPGWHQPGKLQVVTTEGYVRMEDEEPFLRELQAPVSSGP